MTLDEDIVKINKTGHAEAKNAFERMVQRAKFEGPVKNKSYYLIADDFISMGGTVADLRNYIEANGGKVVGVAAIGASNKESLQIAPTKETIARLEKLGRREIEDVLREYGIARVLEGLTESEGRKISNEAAKRNLSGRELGDRRRTLYAKAEKKRDTSNVLRNERNDAVLNETAFVYQQNAKTDPDIQESAETGAKSGANKNKSGIKQKIVEAVQSIPRKSVNEFTSEEIRKTEKYAAQYWREMRTKSPFFRAWFGDWRVKDKTPVTVATKKGDARGVVKNIDTGWGINVSSEVFNETKSHNSSRNKSARNYLPYINDIVKNAVLLDTYSVGDKTKSPNTLLMHSMYAVADIGNGKELLKLYVEEMNDPNADGTAKRAYQLQNIEISAASVRVQGEAPSSLTNTADIKNVADLFVAVKSKDKSFNPKPSSKVVDKDGKPLVVYHGTSKNFTEFKIGDIGYHVGSRDQAESRIRTSDNKVVMPLYISLTNPLEIGMDYGDWGGTNVAIMLLETEVFEDRPDIEEKLSEILEIDRAKNGMSASQRKDRAVKELLQSLGYDGIVYNNTFEGNNRYSGENYSYIAFEPNQIKSAENNIGTFDSENDDIQYSAEPYSAFDPDKKWKTERVGKERKAERLSDIVKDIEKKFGIPITKARVVKGANGTYNTHTHAIRTKVENNLPTIAHELGHHIDNKYSEMKSGKKYRLTSDLAKELRAELIAGADPKFLEQYSPDKHTSEAFAEFMRQYLQNKETARIDYLTKTKLRGGRAGSLANITEAHFF